MSSGKMSEKPDKILGGNLALNWLPIQGEVVILLIASCYMETEINSD